MNLRLVSARRSLSIVAEHKLNVGDNIVADYYTLMMFITISKK
jgi:hypothetical protein